MRACVDGHDDTAVALARHENLDGLAARAIEHGVAGSVYACLGDVEALDERERRGLGAFVLQNRMQHQHVLRDLQYLAGVLEPLGSPWIVVKGPAVAATLYPRADLRNAGDIDVLVGPAQFAAAVELLARAGHPVDDANWPLVRRLTAGQLHVLLPGGTPLDLHWHLLFTAAERERYPLTTAELLARRRTVDIAGAELCTLDPADTLVHLSFHAANEGGDRLSWLADVARAAAAPALDWDDVVRRATAWRMPLPVATVLQRARQQLGAPVPPDVLRRLAPAPWRMLMKTVDPMFPVGGASRRMGNPASLLAKSASVAGTPLGATAAAASGLARRALHLAQTGDATRSDDALRADSEASLRYRAPFNADDRAGYFADVAAAAAREYRSS